jgi:predicted RNA-binding protein with RPS1 domain
LIEEPLRNYLKSASKEIPCKLIEMNGFNLNFLLQEPEHDGIIECAYMRKALNDKTGYEIGNTYNLYLYSRYGEAYEHLSVQPAGLLELIEKEKKKSKVFWNKCKRRIHTKSPVTTQTRKLFHGISDNPDFHTIIDRLYRQSNNIRLDYRFRKMPHEIGEKARREEMLGDLMPVYNRDDKVRGRISAIFDTNVLVALENGGTGNIPLKYLSWRDIIDPRETVDGDQIVEARVVSQDKRGGGKIEDSVHEVEIVKIDDNFALADLEPGLTGFIHISNIKYGHVSTIAAHLKKGERVSARIKKNNINSIAKNPVNIEFSLKDTIQKELPVPENKYKFLIGRGGNTIRELNERSGCNIYLKEKKGIAEIKGSSQESVDEAVRLIKEVLGKKTDANISEKSKTRSSVTKKKTNFCKVKIPIDKTGLLIGKKGKMISQIKKKSDTFIQIDKGTVHIKGRNEDGIKCAIKMINDLIPEMRELL